MFLNAVKLHTARSKKKEKRSKSKTGLVEKNCSYFIRRATTSLLRGEGLNSKLKFAYMFRQESGERIPQLLEAIVVG